MSFFSLIVLLGCALPATDGSATSLDASSSSAFLPQVGQSAHYRYVDTVTTPMQTKSEAVMLTIKSVTENQVRVTIDADGQEPRNLDLSKDLSGALQPTSDQGEQELVSRLSLVARIGTNPRVATSFPVLLNVPWASGPVNPMVSIQPTEPDGFVANANAATTVNPPQPQQRLHVLLAPGIGLTGALIGGTAGRVIAISGLVRTVVVANHNVSKPIQTEVKLHITGHLANGRLQALYGDQENSVHAKNRNGTLSDRWSLVVDDGMI